MMHQVVITLPGEEPPRLTDPNFSTLGFVKADNRKTFYELTKDLTFQPGFTYTVAHWGTSQMADYINWEIQAIPFLSGTSLAQLGFCAPLMSVIYILKDDPTEKKHSLRRRQYLCRMLVDTTLAPPHSRRLRPLPGYQLDTERMPAKDDQPQPRRRIVSSARPAAGKEATETPCFAAVSCSVL